MKYQYRIDYNDLTDEQIVNNVLMPPHNEEGMVFLLYNRYNPMLRKVYKELTTDRRWYDDCVSELFIHLKGKDCTWHNLESFAWQSTLGCWLRRVAKNKFIDILPKLIDKVGSKVYIDDEDSEKSKVQLPDDSEEDYDRRLRKVLLMEAIGKLKDDDEKFVIIKRLEGYKSKEIAVLLDKKWKKHNIVKYNNDGQIVIANDEYVDSKAQKARKHLKELMNNNK